MESIEAKGRIPTPALPPARGQADPEGSRRSGHGCARADLHVRVARSPCVLVLVERPAPPPDQPCCEIHDHDAIAISAPCWARSGR